MFIQFRRESANAHIEELPHETRARRRRRSRRALLRRLGSDSFPPQPLVFTAVSATRPPWQRSTTAR
jgi:hypothetical protein